MTNWPLWGTIVNTAAVLLGALVGLLIKKISTVLSKGESDDEGALALSRNRSSVSDAIMRALGLSVALIGVAGALKIQNVLIMILSMAIGTLVGELLDLDGWVNRLGKWVERRFKGTSGSIAEGLVTATLVFCVGAMTVTGAIESGVAHTHTTYYAKSLLDLISSTVFAATLGFGVLLSAGAVFACQGLLTLLAVLVAGAIPTAVTGEMIAVGSLLMIGIGTNLLGVTRLKVMNMLPSMFLPIVFCPLFSLLPL